MYVAFTANTTTVIAIAVAVGGASLLLIFAGLYHFGRRRDSTVYFTDNSGYYTDVSGVFPAPENDGFTSVSDIILDTTSTRKPSATKTGKNGEKASL